MRVEATEREFETEAATPGGAHVLRLVERWRAAWALERAWAGADRALADKEAEIRRLRELLERTVWELRRPSVSAETVAEKLHRALRGR